MGKNREVYLFRHGQTDWNGEGLIQGHSDIPLNDLGREQAVGLKQSFLELDVSKIYSSDLMRAIETAKIVSENRVSIEYSTLLREANLGVAEGKTLEWARNHYQQLFWEIDSYFNSTADDYWHFAYSDGESRITVVRRFLKLFDKIAEDRVAFSMHGGIMRLVILYFLEQNGTLKTAESVNIPIPNCALYKLDFTDQQFVGYLPLSLSSV